MSEEPRSTTSNQVNATTAHEAATTDRAAFESAALGDPDWRIRRGAVQRLVERPLTSEELAGLLSILAEKPGQAVSREELSLSFSGNVRNVDVQMTRLRRKIERDPRFPRFLQTVRGTGYMLKPD